MTNFSFDHDRVIDVIAMGRVAVDLYAEQIGAPLSEAQSFRKYLGGCAGNIAVGCARLGLRSSMLSAVGSDHMGQFLRDTLLLEGVDISALQVSEKHLTGLVMLGVCPPDHFPLIFYRNDCADMAVDGNAIDQSYLKSAKSLLVTGTGLSHPRTRAVTMHTIKLAKDVGTKIILDIDYRPVLWGLLAPGDGEKRYQKDRNVSEIFKAMVPLADLVVGTEEEIKIAGGSDDLNEALHRIREISRAPIVMKMGERGAACFAHDLLNPNSAKSFPVKIMNVLGAGDAFMSGLLSSLLTGGSMDDALTRANACGAIVVSRHGCSHASPSLAELEYFLAHHDDHEDALHKPHMKLQRQRTILKNRDRIAPMPVFAFCHRIQFEEVCVNMGQPLHKITEFKAALADALVAACNEHDIRNAYLLCDPKYGGAAIARGQNASLGIIVAIEKSGVQLTEWLEPGSAYEILHRRPASFGVKILWQFHEDLSTAVQEHQLNRLHELHDACNKLDRKLMLELILSPSCKGGDEEVLRSVEKVYREGINPYWWKLAAFSSKTSWRQLDTLIDEFDADARVLILGGHAKKLEDYAHDFALAKSSRHGIGFAVGRSIFWPIFMNYIQGECSLEDVKARAAKNFLHLHRIWTTAHVEN